ncbi:hypothetical protein EGM51_07395 [Verrucomicrobia bacterium S94]|nr:hypothetical protein EGM51_07395 [Verrucomicrobia bacterium S94]
MKKIFAITCALSVIGSMASYADVTLFDDDFSSSTIANDGRISRDDVGEGWRKNTNSLWTASGGNLANAGTTAGVPSEGAVGQVISVTTTDTSLTKIQVSFDYVVGTGSTLYFHLHGYTENGAPAANEPLANTGAQNGRIQNQAENEYADISLLDGSDPETEPSGYSLFAAGTSGNYAQTFDLTEYSWSADELPGISGSIGSIADFDLILAAFASKITQTDGSGAISVDNFKVTAIPEPAVLGLVVLFGSSFFFVRHFFDK